MTVVARIGGFDMCWRLALGQESIVAREAGPYRLRVIHFIRDP